jgi:hypothetical protein
MLPQPTNRNCTTLAVRAFDPALPADTASLIEHLVDLGMSRRHYPRWLQRLCQIPDPCASHEQAARWRHSDVPSMPPDALRRERGQIRVRLLVEEEPPRWLLGRLRVLDAALGGAQG